LGGRGAHRLSQLILMLFSVNNFTHLFEKQRIVERLKYFRVFAVILCFKIMEA
jgi:hypothetical protein